MAKDKKTGRTYISEAQSKAREAWEDKQQRKMDSVVERQEYRDSLSPEQQLARLDQRLGQGVGAKKERKRLSN